jgi:hypothetical protein
VKMWDSSAHGPRAWEDEPGSECDSVRVVSTSESEEAAPAPGPASGSRKAALGSASGSRNSAPGSASGSVPRSASGLCCLAQRVGLFSAVSVSEDPEFHADS